MQERTIIDGQQRLTTLQLLFDALHAELVAAGATAASMRLETIRSARPIQETKTRFGIGIFSEWCPIEVIPIDILG